MRLRLFLIVLAPIVTGADTMAAPVCTLGRANGTNIDPAPLLRNAYGVRWNAASNRIAYMRPGASGYYRVFTARPDGTCDMQVACTVAVSPDGTSMLGGVQDSLVRQTGFVRVVHFTCP